MPTWKEQMELDARYARSLNRPGVYTMPLPEDKPPPPRKGLLSTLLVFLARLTHKRR